MDGLTAEVLVTDHTTGPLENPFGDDVDGAWYPVPDKEIHLAQLRAEFKAEGYDAMFSLQDRVDEADLLFIAGRIPADAVSEILGAHEADWEYGQTDLQKAGTAALLKAREGKTLTLKEISAYIGTRG